MRLPTKPEWEAFQSESVSEHQHCHNSGVCVHKEEIKELCKLLYCSPLFVVSANATPHVPLDEQLYLFTIAFREGISLGMKLAEKDALEKMCQT